MGTRLDLVLPDVDPWTGHDFRSEAETLVRGLERRLSRFDPQSPVSRLNREAGRAEVGVDAFELDVLRLCRDYHARTAGAFDITLLPLLEAWKEAARARQRLPAARIARIREATGMDLIEVDPERSTVRFRHPNAQLDFGGFGKGFALQALDALLDEWRLPAALLSFGDSAVLARGHHPHGTGWRVGIRHLFGSGTTVYDFHAVNQSVSTSGNVPGNTVAHAPWFGHVLSPHNGQPIAGTRTLSVLSDSPLDAEVLSTALLVLSPAERASVCDAFPGATAVEISYEEDREGLVVWESPSTVLS